MAHLQKHFHARWDLFKVAKFSTVEVDTSEQINDKNPNYQRNNKTENKQENDKLR